MKRVLVVDDEKKLAGLLQQAFSESGFICETASDGVEGLAKASDADVMIVDVMMPQMNGFELISRLREQGSSTPILLLTAMDSTRDIVEGLDVGADDYLVKPFKLDELLARVRALLRRSQTALGLIEWEDLALDPANRSATRNGHELFLSSTEFELLATLARKPGKTHSRTELLDIVWKDEGYRAENIVALYVNYLRKKTETFGMPRIVHTIRGEGYVLASEAPE